MAAVLVYTAENMIESFLEPVLDLLAALIEFDRDALAAGAPGALPASAMHASECTQLEGAGLKRERRAPMG